MGSKLNYQKKRNNRRIYSNLKVVGYLKKLKANTIIIYDDQSKNSFRISKQELKKAFVGDKVQCSLTPKGWAKIEKVIERVKKMCLLDIAIPYTDIMISEGFRGGELT